MTENATTGGFAMLSLCNHWEFTPNWYESFETGEGQGESVRLPHNDQYIPVETT